MEGHPRGNFVTFCPQEADLIMFCPLEGTLKSTSSLFVQWKGNLHGIALHFFSTGRHPWVHFITFSPLEGHPRRHFCGVVSNMGAPGVQLANPTSLPLVHSEIIWDSVHSTKHTGNTRNRVSCWDHRHKKALHSLSFPQTTRHTRGGKSWGGALPSHSL